MGQPIQSNQFGQFNDLNRRSQQQHFQERNMPPEQKFVYDQTPSHMNQGQNQQLSNHQPVKRSPQSMIGHQESPHNIPPQIQDMAAESGFNPNMQQQPHHNQGSSSQSIQYNQQQMQQHSTQLPQASHHSQTPHSTEMHNIPQYTQSRPPQQPKLSSAQFDPPPSTSMQLQMNIPQQKPGPYSQQAQSQPLYSDQFSHQQHQQQHAPMQQMQPPSSSQRPHAPGPVIPRVAQANRMMRPPVSAGPRMAPPPSQMMPPPPLPAMQIQPVSSQMMPPPQVLPTTSVQQTQYIQPPVAPGQQLYGAQTSQAVQVPSQQYQQQTDPASAFMQQPGQMGPPLQPLQQQQSYAATSQRPVQPKTVLINPKFNQKQHQPQARQQPQERYQSQERQPQERQPQERQQSRPVDRVSQQQVRGHTDSSRSRSRESNPRKGARLHPLDELYQVSMMGIAVVKHIPNPKCIFLVLDAKFPFIVMSDCVLVILLHCS